MQLVGLPVPSRAETDKLRLQTIAQSYLLMFSTVSTNPQQLCAYLLYADDYAYL